MSEELTMKEGTINFWLKEKSVNFNDSSVVKLFAINPIGGSVLIIKDSDKKIKVFFVRIGRGRDDIEAKISDLNELSANLVTFTWSEKKISLYINGDLRGEKEFD